MIKRTKHDSMIRKLIFLIFLSLFLFQTRSLSDAQDSSLGIANLHKVISVVLVFGLSLNYFFKCNIKSKPNNFLKIYGLYLFTGLISSIFFSDWVGYSLWKLLELYSVFFAVMLIHKLAFFNFSYLEYSFNLVIKYFKVLIIISLLGVLVVPNIAIRPPSLYQDAYLPYQLFGSLIKINANSLGMISAILFFISIVDYFYYKKKRSVILWITISLVVMIFAQSRTSVGSLLVIMTFFGLITNKISRFSKLLISFIGFYVVYINLNSIILYLGRGYDIQHLEKLSGRLDWWLSAWETFIQSSVLEKIVGLGFAISNRVILRDIGHGEAATLHSDHFDSLISTGFFGLLMIWLCFGMVIFKIFKNISIIKHNPLLIKLSGVFLLLFFRSFSGTSITFHNFFLVIFLISSVTIIQYTKIYNKKRYVSE